MGVRAAVLWVSGLAMGVAACTLWVDNQWKGYSGTCQLPSANANVCGQCATQHCQAFVDRTCGNLVTDQLEQCLSDPSYSASYWTCGPFFDDASVYDPTQTADESNLRHCVHDSCTGPCSTCTDFDAGAGACGDCLRASCASTLNGNGGCCGDDQIASAMVACGSSVNHDCSEFLTYDAAPPPDGGYDYNACFRVFAGCLQSHCSSQCR